MRMFKATSPCSQGVCKLITAHKFLCPKTLDLFMQSKIVKSYNDSLLIAKENLKVIEKPPKSTHTLAVSPTVNMKVSVYDALALFLFYEILLIHKQTCVVSYI